MKAGRIILRAFLIIVIGLTVGLTVYTWNARRVFHNEMPMPFGVGASIVLTGSMEPTLQVNDLVVVKAADSFAVGDIVVFQQGDTLVIHRIIEIDEETAMIKTQGDANNVDDGWISLSTVKGKYSFRIPFVGVIVNVLKSVPGTIAILALAAFLMIRSWKNERRESEKDIEALKAEIAELKGETAPDAASVEEEIRKLREELGQAVSEEENNDKIEK
ncbi:MAG: signal peptidase I [Clostridia bacterium]|nr:signal peptidase I [Clostridia bacterium]